MPDITPSKYRSQANGIINFMGGIGAIIAYLVGANLYDMNPAYPFWLGSVLVIFAALMVLIFIREPKEFETSDVTEPRLWATLKKVWNEPDKSPLRILLAIFSWFVAYNAIEAFFTLYSVNHLGLGESDGSRLLGQLSFFFVLMAIPAGLIGGRIGRRRTIMMGIAGLAACMLAMFLVPAQTLTIGLNRLPVLGNVPVVGVILMVAGISWALININSLPMVVDMTDDLHVGTYTGLYYMVSAMAAILGPNINGLIIQLTGENYASIMIIGPIFMILAFILMAGVRRGEAKTQTAGGQPQ
jgi:MFS family permease